MILLRKIDQVKREIVLHGTEGNIRGKRSNRLPDKKHYLPVFMLGSRTEGVTIRIQEKRDCSDEKVKLRKELPIDDRKAVIRSIPLRQR